MKGWGPSPSALVEAEEELGFEFQLAAAPAPIPCPELIIRGPTYDGKPAAAMVFAVSVGRRSAAKD